MVETQTAADRAPAIAPGEQPDDHAVEMVAAVLRAPRDRPSAPWLLLAGTLVLFVLGSGYTTPVVTLAITVGVLFFHEAGHALAMRALGYADVRVFFIPFLGAAATGDQAGVAAWRRGVVLLAGPLPGLLCGSAMLLTYPPSAWARSVAVMLVVINGLNLLPLHPLDGGRLVALLTSWRPSLLDPLLRAVAAAVFLALGIWLHDAPFYVLAGLAVLSVRNAARTDAAALKLRARWPALPERLTDASAAQRRDLAAETLASFGRPDLQREPPTVDAAIQRVAHRARAVYERALDHRPSRQQSLVLGCVYAAGLFLAALFLPDALRGGTTSHGKPGAIEELADSTDLPAARIVAHYPASFLAKRSTPTLLILSRDFGDTAELVLFFTFKAAPGGAESITAAMDKTLREHYGFEPGAPKEATCNGEPGLRTVGPAVFPKSGFRLRVSACAFTKWGRGFYFVSMASVAFAAAEEPVLTRIVEATEIQP
jgi:Zn-dependent protease